MTALKTLAVSSPRDWRRFLRFPGELYAADPRWVPPLAFDEEQRVGFRRHPFHDVNRVQAFLAEKEGRVVGRVAAIDNARHNRQYGERRGFFGFFECRDDLQVARALLGAAADWLVARGLTELRGPMNPSIDYQAGLLIDAFHEPPSFLMPYNPPYYAGLLENCGLAKSHDLLALACDRAGATTIMRRGQPVKQRLLERRALRLRALDRRRLHQDLSVFLSVVNRSLVGHWGYVPLATAEMNHMAEGLRWLLVRQLALLAEVDGEPVGAALALPDYNPRVRRIGGRLLPFGFMRLFTGKRRLKHWRLVGVNVLPEWKRLGVGVALTTAILEEALAAGAECLEISWIAESNHLSYGTLENAGARRSKVYRVYDAPL